MHQPATTNPMIIMVINMTVVFLVLVMLMYVIKLIHFVDPTKEREPNAAAVQEPAPSSPPPSPVAEPLVDGVPDEVVAVIAAAVASSGGGDIRVIRPLGESGWRGAGRMEGIGAR